MLRQLRERHLVLWGYGVEIFASLPLCWLIEHYAGRRAVAHFIYVRKADIFFTVGLAATICGLFFAAFVSFMCTDFGKRLRQAGAAVEYLAAFLIPFLALAAAAACLHFVSSDAPTLLADASLLVLVYSAINCITMPKNLIAVTRLWQDLDRRA
jgi:hypothetical protein